MSFLSNLPSSGNFVNVTHQKAAPSSYVCTHATSAPENQYITTDDVNPLVRALKRRQQQKQNLKRTRESGPTNEAKRRKLEEP